MTSSEIKAAITAWCREDTTLQLGQEGEDATGFWVRLTTGDDSPTAVEVVYQLSAPDRVMARHTFTVGQGELAPLPGESPEDKRESFLRIVEEVALSRPGLLSCKVQSRGEGFEVVVSHPIYQDGFARHAFMCAVHEVAKAGQQIRASLALWGVQMEELRGMQPGLTAVAPPPREEPKAKMPAAAGAQPLAPSPPRPAGPTFCTQCGIRLEAGTRFCINCGHPMSS